MAHLIYFRRLGDARVAQVPPGASAVLPSPSQYGRPFPAGQCRATQACRKQTCLAETIHHNSSLFITRAARRRRLAFDISTRHSGFRLQCPLRAPWRLPDPPAIPLQINAIGATPTAREEPSPTPQNSTLFDTDIEFCRIAHSGRCFRLIFVLDMGCILKMGKGLFEIGFVPQKCFSHTVDYAFGCSDNDKQ